MALRWPAIRSAGRYDSHRNCVRCAVQENVRGANFWERGDERMRRGNDAASDREAIVAGAVKGAGVVQLKLTTPFLNSRDAANS